MEKKLHKIGQGYLERLFAQFCKKPIYRKHKLPEGWFVKKYENNILKEIWIYFQDGKLKSYGEFEEEKKPKYFRDFYKNGNFKEIRRYNKSGKLLKRESFFEDGSKKELNLWSYDLQNKKTKFEKTTFYINGNKKSFQRKTTSYVYQEWSPEGILIYRRVKIKGINHEKSKWNKEGVLLQKFSFDNKGFILKKEYWYNNGIPEKKIFLENGKVIRIETYYKNGKRKEISKWNSERLPLKQETYHENGTPDEIIEYQHGGRKTITTFFKNYKVVQYFSKEKLLHSQKFALLEG